MDVLGHVEPEPAATYATPEDATPLTPLAAALKGTAAVLATIRQGCDIAIASSRAGADSAKVTVSTEAELLPLLDMARSAQLPSAADSHRRTYFHYLHVVAQQ